MTITGTLNKKQYEGNGLATEFPLPFTVADKTHIFAILKKDSQIEEVKTNYEVDMERKVFRYPLKGEPLKSGQMLTVYRKVPLTQIVDLQNAGAFHPEVLERDGFDRLVMQIQQLDEAIGRCLKIDMTDNRDVSAIVSELFQVREFVLEQAGLAEQFAQYAKAWAQSEQNPDSTDLESKSSKTWALLAKNKAEQLTDLQVDCKISNDGTGGVFYHKERNLLEIILPFDNSGANHAKVVLTDEISLSRSDIAASAKAVHSLNMQTAKYIADISQHFGTLLLDKLDKSAVSSSLVSSSEETAASSLAVKQLNDKIGSVQNSVSLKSTRTTAGAWTITGLTPGKPLFIILGNTAKTAGYAWLSLTHGTLDTAQTVDNVFFYTWNVFGRIFQFQSWGLCPNRNRGFCICCRYFRKSYFKSLSIKEFLCEFLFIKTK